MNGNDARTVEALAQKLGQEVDWEPRILPQPYRPRRRRKVVGL
ncbi:MAG: hypothetical protein R3F62_17725 [Planctomycetota bacterium]